VKNSLSTARTFVVVVLLGLFGMAARNITDPDLWWHLKAGQYIVEHRSVPRTDPFSYTRVGQPWVAHEWLSEVLLFELERVAGFGGLIVVFAGVLCAAFFLLYLRCGTDQYVAAAMTLCGAWATIPVWGVRPQIISLLLTSLWLLILERSERTPTLLWWTVPLTLLWVNLHAGFAMGLALSALFLAGDWIERMLGRSQPRGAVLHSEAPNRARPHIAILILLIDLLIVPLNPNGMRLFWYPVETLRSAAMQNYIAEWASPNFHHAQYWPFLLIVLASFAVLAWSQKEVRPRDLLLLLVSLYAGLVSLRMMPLFILVAIPLVATRLESRADSSALQRPAAPNVLLNFVIVLAMAAFVGLHVVQVIHRQAEVEKKQFPSRAVEFLQAHSPTGRIFNHYDWGGYLIWRLYPSTQVFIDGRADLYGETLLNQFADTYQLKRAWQQTLLDWNIHTVIIPRDSALATGLESLPGWSVSYEDEQAVILTAPTRIQHADLAPDAEGIAKNSSDGKR
jgi:hypothetical protein